MKRMARLIFFLFWVVMAGGFSYAQTDAPERQFKVKPIDSAYGWKSPTPSESDIPKPLTATVVDDFQDSSLTGWWGFGDLLFSVVENSAGEYDPTVQGRSIRLEGKAKDRYIGGCGRVLGLDAAHFNAIKLMIKGNMPGKSGVLIIELYPSQDNAWVNEASDRREWFLRYEHRYFFTLTIDWKGWRVVTIPFRNFLKDGPRVKHPIWNSATNSGVGSLIQMQFLVLSAARKGQADFQIDSVSFVKDLNPQALQGLLDY